MEEALRDFDIDNPVIFRLSPSQRHNRNTSNPFHKQFDHEMSSITRKMSNYSAFNNYKAFKTNAPQSDAFSKERVEDDFRMKYMEYFNKLQRKFNAMNKMKAKERVQYEELQKQILILTFEIAGLYVLLRSP
eukprot:TRINITY_DN14461_c0_g2_i3.p2 TRINITY_DN14461_c0_g2~~TRINITY_DN14461_c0_g2_i3.p2  ORF type:complete len:132 (-),score=31.70 TRINITY_DN14461_c0_g2_i3:1397-1792(-)